jgi:hypothetical protein
MWGLLVSEPVQGKMMLIDSKLLRELGCQNVMGVDTPVTMVNGDALRAAVIKYDDLNEFKETPLFQDAVGGAILIVCDNPVEGNGGAFIRLFVRG